MKAILQFDLPNENYEYRQAVNAGEWRSVCWDLDVKLRAWLKYGHQFDSADQALETVRRLLNESVQEAGLDLMEDY